VGSNSEIQGYNFYPMLYFCRKFSSGVILFCQVMTPLYLSNLILFSLFPLFSVIPWFLAHRSF